MMNNDEKKLDLHSLRRNLRNKEYKKEEIWTDYWWVLWFLLATFFAFCWLSLLFLSIGAIILIKKLNKYSKLKLECKKIEAEIRNLEEKTQKNY